MRKVSLSARLPSEMEASNTLLTNEQDKDLRIASLELLLKREQDKSKHFEQEISWLHEQLRALKRAKFGKKSEAWESQEQLTFNEAENEAKKAKDDDTQAEAEVDVKAVVESQVAAHKRKPGGHRKPLPSDLPREIVKVELPPEELVNETGEPLKVIGWMVSEKLKYEPAKMSVIEYHRAKYGVDTGDYVKSAPPVPSVIPKGIATPELLSAIITAKYADGLPLYRIEDIFTRLGIDLGRGTMGRWMVQVAEALMPILNVLSDRLFASYAIAADETSMQVLKEEGRKPETKSWMIVRMNPVEEKKVVLFDYSISRSGATMKDLFADYQGRLLCDGLQSYSPLESENLIRFGCNMHSRRRFEQAANEGAKAGKTIASRVMDLYKKIYDHEEELENSPPEEKAQARQDHQKPLFEEIRAIVKDNRPKVPDKSKIGEAFKYFENEYDYLTRYLADPLIGPDNGMVERTIRKFAIGRNNWLFADTPAGADASALLYSLVITAKVNGVNPYTAMVKILTEIPKATSIEDFERLAEVILAP